MKWTRRLAASFRQTLYPEEFRLPEAEFEEEQLNLLEELIQMIQPTLCQADAAQKQEKRQMARFLADLGTGIWRIRKKVEGLKRMPKEMKDALFALESTWESMAQGGVEILDHVGEVPLGMVPRVVQTLDVPGLPREQIVEALSPTILLRGEVVQVGEVVLGRPAPLGAGPAPEVSHG